MNEDECSIGGCLRPIFNKANGWCRSHYYRWYKYGDPLAGGKTRIPAGIEGWKSRYVVNPDTGCWDWTGSLDKHGYGQYDVNDENGKRKNWRAHRYVYTQLIRPLLDNEVIDHLCRNHKCVNPGHLDPTTQQVNTDRGDHRAGRVRKTHCKWGHEFTPENTIVATPTGGRNCLQCRRDINRVSMRRYRERRASE